MKIEGKYVNGFSAPPPPKNPSNYNNLLMKDFFFSTRLIFLYDKYFFVSIFRRTKDKFFFLSFILVSRSVKMGYACYVIFRGFFIVSLSSFLTYSKQQKLIEVINSDGSYFRTKFHFLCFRCEIN